MYPTIESIWPLTFAGQMNQLSNSLCFGKYNTWNNWGLITTALVIEPPELKTNYIDLGGVSGTIDLTEALSEQPVYKDRRLKATFWTRQGTRQEREQLLQGVLRAIHGRKLKITVPDTPGSYFFGRVAVKEVTRHERHLQFSIEAICDPWRYDNNFSKHSYTVDGTQEIKLYNHGVAVLCPDITVTGTVTFTCNGVTTTASDGTYKIATFKLFEGENIIGLSGSGTLTLRYREATL